MDASCDLEVDVNGEETFFIHEKIISSYCGKIRKLFAKSKGPTKNLKVIFNDFPGGPESFELVSRFCYNKGKIVINPYTSPRLFRAAHYMEMNEKVSGSHNLLEKTEKSLEEIKFWSWIELLSALKYVAISSKILQKCLDSLVARLIFAELSLSCPSISSPESSALRLSTDSKSTESGQTRFLRSTWWFEDLVNVLTPDLVKPLVKSIIFHNFDHGVTSRFLVYYHKSRFITASPEEKREITETVIDSLCLLDQNSNSNSNSVSCKNLFGILRVSSNLNISKISKNNLERMIGSRLDQATLDDLLVPSPHGSNYLYDVNLVLQLLKYFLAGKGGGGGGCLAGKSGGEVAVCDMKKVARLIDLYVAEVAPDPRLKPYKFLALLKILPECSRDSYDEMYHAINIYLQVHMGLSDEEKTNICASLNYEKLSSEICNHVMQNEKFPSKITKLALKAQQVNLENLFLDIDIQKRFALPPCETETKDGRHGQVVLYAKQVVPHGGKMDIVNENEKMRAHLEGMQWRVIELEKVCKKMQTQMTKILKSRLSRQNSAKSLPRLCS
ncbi:BTB/POZ domain-containing protein At3g22104 isoform X1 [Lactuca sativa]|uniref:NPH3 domain-containing protein n=2 Tax=Lactuca sativa TaxID=4236 RepID=A0A9R1WXI7_LACSA|nr:BTB/POZ domain-containing protein At3g22104 isoform X1 [Lactuca sativa]KAJ0188987.1 hypothetical protein LSAT_V11C800441740 [Lactuca sativa]